MSKGLDFDMLYPGRFLKAGEFDGREVTLKIASVRREDLADVEDPERKKTKPKALLSFEPTAPGKPAPKEMVICKTVGICLREMFGRDSGEWVGRRVTFRPEMVDAFGAQTLAIRVSGSPDIPADHTFKLKLTGKSPRVVTLRKTGGKAKPSAPAPAAPSSPPTGHEPPPLSEPPPDALLPGQHGYGEPPPPGDADAPGGAQ